MNKQSQQTSGHRLERIWFPDIAGHLRPRPPMSMSRTELGRCGGLSRFCISIWSWIVNCLSMWHRLITWYYNIFYMYLPVYLWFLNVVCMTPPIACPHDKNRPRRRRRRRRRGKSKNKQTQEEHKHIENTTSSITALNTTSNLLFFTRSPRCVRWRTNALSASLSPRCCGHDASLPFRDVEAHRIALHFHLLLRRRLFQTGMVLVFTSSLNWPPLALHKGDCISNLERTFKIACQCHRGQSSAQMQTHHAKGQNSKRLGLTTTRSLGLPTRTGDWPRPWSGATVRCRIPGSHPCPLATRAQWSQCHRLVVVNKCYKVHWDDFWIPHKTWDYPEHVFHQAIEFQIPMVPYANSWCW